jgi:hypothetical protein
VRLSYHCFVGPGRALGKVTYDDLWLVACKMGNFVEMKGCALCNACSRHAVQCTGGTVELYRKYHKMEQLVENSTSTVWPVLSAAQGCTVQLHVIL